MLYHFLPQLRECDILIINDLHLCFNHYFYIIKINTTIRLSLTFNLSFQFLQILFYILYHLYWINIQILILYAFIPWSHMSLIAFYLSLRTITIHWTSDTCLIKLHWFLIHKLLINLTGTEYYSMFLLYILPYWTANQYQHYSHY